MQWAAFTSHNHQNSFLCFESSGCEKWQRSTSVLKACSKEKTISYAFTVVLLLEKMETESDESEERGIACITSLAMGISKKLLHKEKSVAACSG